MLFLALSCLQGRLATNAAEELLALEPDGIQLTPGNLPTAGFELWFREKGIPFSLHHGFDWEMRKRRVWHQGACQALPGASVHAPLNPLNSQYLDSGFALEVMYRGYGLGSGPQVEEAMERGTTLVVDVSHIYLQLEQGLMREETWKRLQNYRLISEVHVSANDGVGDIHSPLEDDTFGVPWALEQSRAGIPMVLECYMHRLSVDERRAQLDMLRS